MIKFNVKATHLEAAWRSHFQLIIAVALGLIGIGLAYFGYLEMTAQPGGPGIVNRIVIESGDTDATNHLFSASDNEVEQIYGDFGPAGLRTEFASSVDFASSSLMAIGDSAAGSVHIYEKDASGQWNNVYTFSEAGIGGSVAFNGVNTLAFGNPTFDGGITTTDLKSNLDGDQYASGDNLGIVHVITKTGNDWSANTRAQVQSSSEGSFFGTSVAFSSSGQLAVGASGSLLRTECGPDMIGPNTETFVDEDDVDGDSDTTETITLYDAYPCGQVYIYELSSGDWTLTSNQIPSDYTDYDDANEIAPNRFGSSVAFSSAGHLAVGAINDIGDLAVGYTETPGSVLIFSLDDDDAWQVFKITDRVYPDTSTVDTLHHELAHHSDFGSAVTFIDGDTLAVGAKDANTVYLFNESSGAWTADSLTIVGHQLGSGKTIAERSYFGIALASNGDTLAVGANQQMERRQIWADDGNLTPQVREGVLSLVGLASLRKTTAWRYVYLSGTDVCNAAAFTGSSPTTYTEGEDIDGTAKAGERLCFEATPSGESAEYLASQEIDLSPPDLSQATLSLTDDGSITIDFGSLVRQANDLPIDANWVRLVRLEHKAHDTSLFKSLDLLDADPLISVEDQGGSTIMTIAYDVDDSDWPPATAPSASTPLTFSVWNIDVEDHDNNRLPSGTITRQIEAYQTAGPLMTVDIDQAAQTLSVSDDVDAGGSTLQYVAIGTDVVCDDQVSFSSATSYVEGSNIRLEESHNGQRLCFRSYDTANDLSGYRGVDISDVDRTAPVISVVVASDNVSATTDTTGANLDYVILDALPCASSVDFTTATSYATAVPITFPAHAEKYFCFRGSDAKGNTSYAASGKLNAPPVVQEITITGRNYAPPFAPGQRSTIRLTFSKDIELTTTSITNFTLTFDNLETADSLSAIDRAVGFGRPGDDYIEVWFTPVPGDYTTGIDTADPDDDEYLKIDEIVLLHGATLTGTDGVPAILTIADEINIDAVSEYQRRVDARIPTVTVTNPTNLDTDSAHKIFSAVDDWDGNENQEDNGAEEAFDAASGGSVPHYIFEYYFVPAAIVDATDSAEVGRNCAAHYFDSYAIPASDRYSYTEGSDLVVTDEYDNHYICFRSRRQDTAYRGEGRGYDGAISALIENVDTDRPTITVSDGSADDTFKAVDATSTGTTWHYGFIAGDADCDRSADFSTSYTEGADVAYGGPNNGQKACFRSQDDTTKGYSYAASATVSIESVAPTITNISATSDVYTTGETITITVTFSEEVSLSSGGSPRLELGLSGEPEATYNSAPTTSTMQFSYDVADGDEAADLDVIRFNLNNSTIADASNNALVTTIPDAAKLAATSNVVVDTEPPAIQVGSLDANNRVSASVSDNLDASPDFESKTILTSVQCTSTETAFSAYLAGTMVSVQEGQKVCFRATDHAGNSNLVASNSARDITAPAVTVTSPDTSPAASKVISYQSTDSDVDAWHYMTFDPATSATCAASLFTGDETVVTGGSLTVDQESYNGNKVCFRATDGDGNSGYASSDVINGLDDSPPQIGLVYNEDIVVSVSDPSGLESDSLQYGLIAASTTCNSDTMAPLIAADSTTDYLDGSTIEVETSHVGSKFCFTATDSLGHEAYRDTKVIAADNTAPTVTVTSPNTTPAQEKVFRASSADTDADVETWEYKLYDPDSIDCGTALMNAVDAISFDISEGVTLDSEAANGQRVCFSVSDNSGNPGYGSSDVIAGIDRTAPTVTVTGVETGYLVAGDDETTPTSYRYLVIAEDDDCQAANFANAASYSESSRLPLVASYQGQVICLMASDLAGNSTRVASDAVTTTVVVDTTTPDPETDPDEDEEEPEDAEVDPETEEPVVTPTSEDNRPQASEVPDLSDDEGGSSATVLVIGLVSVFVIIVIATRRRNRNARG